MGIQRSAADPRGRTVAAAADMIRRRGLNATSVRELAKYAETPLGSTYHYFPGGKSQLAIEAVDHAAGTVAAILERRLAADGPAAGLEAFLATWRGLLLDSEFRAGCPLLAVSIEEPAEAGGTEILDAAERGFDAWRRLLTNSLHAQGVSEDKARQLATIIIASVEGALAMCRAARDIRPLDDVSAQLKALIAGSLA